LSSGRVCPSLFKLFLLSRVILVIVVGVPEDWPNEGEEVGTDLGIVNHIFILKPNKILARLLSISFTFEVITRASIYEGLDVADVVVASDQTVGIRSTNDSVAFIKN
jgi:hypothetical protein